jgi:peptidoglycan/LPS O-acetylase OafA/YrhL
MTLAWLPALLLAMVSLPGALTPAVREQFSGTALICALTLSNGWGLPNSQGWNSVSWSVGSEWFAYLTFPLAAVLLNRVHTTRAALLLAGSSLGVPLALSIAINGGEHYMLPWNWTIVRVETAFLLGCSVFQIAKRPYPNIVANCLLAASLVVIVWIVARGAPGLEIGALLLSFALLIASLAKSGSVGDAIFGGRPLIFLGRISYSIYLSHALVLVLFKQVLERTVHVAGPLVSTLILTAYLTAVVAAGYLLFAAIENPARRILRRIWIGGADEVVIAPATAG